MIFLFLSYSMTFSALTPGADGFIITGSVPDTTMAIKNPRDLGFTGPIVSDYAVDAF
jgi:hypothetical protein